MKRRPSNRNRATASAPRKPTTIPTTTATDVMIRLLQQVRLKKRRVDRGEEVVQRRVQRQEVGVNVSTSFAGLNAVMIIQ